MNIKKTLRNIASVLAVFTWVFSTGCSEDFLEKPKGGDVTVDTIFNTQVQAKKAVAQMYNKCITCYNPYNYYGGRPGSITDEIYIMHTANDSWAAKVNNTTSYVVGNMSASASCDYMGWSSHWLGIRTANLVYENIGKVKDADAGYIADVKAQAIFCRAYQHYELFMYYGGIPLLNHSLSGNDLYYPRRSVAATVDTICKWCDEAAAVLPETRPSTDFGMVTKIGALALKARVLLLAASPLYNTPDSRKSEVANVRFGDDRDSVLCYPTYDKERWKRAADASLAVMNAAPAGGIGLYDTGKPETTNGAQNYSDLGDYESAWNVYANKEIILANTKTINQTDGWNNGDIWSLYMSSKLYYQDWGIKNIVPNEFIQLYEKRDGSKFTVPESGTNLPDDVMSWNLDPRFYQSIAYDGMWYCSSIGYLKYYMAGDGFAAGNLVGSDGTPNGYAVECYKFVPRVENKNANHFFWPTFRYAEFVLSYAEALNEYSGPSKEAYDALNSIRKRAGMPDKSGLDQPGFRTAVQNERTVEMAFEATRYSDLMRWLTAPTVLSQQLTSVKTTAKKAANGSMLRSWVKANCLQRVWKDKYYYVPFPSAECSKMYLGAGDWDGQNPGW